MPKILRSDTACHIMFGPFVDKTTGVDLEVAAGIITSIDHATTGIFLSKNGAAGAIRSQAVTASVLDAYGMFQVHLSTTDTDTPGNLRVMMAEAATFLPVHDDYLVIPHELYDTLFVTQPCVALNKFFDVAASVLTCASVNQVQDNATTAEIKTALETGLTLATLSVTGQMDVGNLLVDGTTVLTGTVGAGATTVASLTSTGALTAGTMSVTGQLDAGNLLVDGTTVLTGTVGAGATTLASLTSSGAITTATMSVTGQLDAGNVLVDSTAVITGATTFTGTTTHTGAVTLTAGINAGAISGTLANDLITAASIANGAIDNATFAADVGSTAAATNIISQAVELVIKANNLDHLLKTAKETNWATTVTKESIIDLMTSKDTSQTYARGTDSLEATRDAIVASNPILSAATANTETTGELHSGTYADTVTNDGTAYIVHPAGSAVDGFGLNCALTFNIGTGRAPSTCIVDGHFHSGASRTVQVWAYNYYTAAYVQLSNSANDFGNSTSDSQYVYALSTQMVKVDGEVSIRFTSTSITATDEWQCDYCVVNSVAQEAAGLTADAIQKAVWYRTDSGHDESTLGYNLAHMFLRKGHPVAATSGSQFTIDVGSTVNDAYNGMLIMLEDKTDDHYEVRRVVDYIGGTKEVFLDTALTFTPAAEDDFYILSGGYANVNVTHIGGTAQAAGDVVTQATEANAHGHAIDLQTAKLVFTVANKVDANVKTVNDLAIDGAGTTLDPWGPA